MKNGENVSRFEQLLNQLNQPEPNVSPEDRSDFDWIQGFVTLARASKLEQLPDATHNQLNNVFNSFVKARRKARWTRILATLSFDSGQAAIAPVGVRAGQDSSRQLVYSVDEQVEIALDITVEGNNVALYGQVFLDEAAEDVMLVQLVEHSAEVATTTTDELGEFNLSNVSPGQYNLVITTEQGEIELQDIPIQPQ